MTSRREWAVALFNKSVLKQRKLAEVAALLGPTEGCRALDLGSDNGVVSLLLRERGGSWASGDLTDEAVASIRGLVETDVHKVAGDHLPFADAAFDVVAVVDMLEHVTEETAFVRELARVTKPGGRLVVNTPHLKRTWLRRSAPRPGPDRREARPPAARLHQGAAATSSSRPAFALESHHTYSRFFSEAVDTAINWAVERTGKRGSAKGMVVTGADVAKNQKLFRLYSLVYPLVWAITRLDALVPASGYMLIAAARRRDLA